MYSTERFISSKKETEQDTLGTSCAPTDLDLSPGAFKKLADSASGRVHVSWAWLPPTSSIHGALFSGLSHYPVAFIVSFTTRHTCVNFSKHMSPKALR